MIRMKADLKWTALLLLTYRPLSNLFADSHEHTTLWQPVFALSN